MELGVRQFRLHEQFHGIPWNSMEFKVRQFRWHEQFHGIPWNSMELGVRQFRWHEQFHGIPWNFMELGVCQFRWHEQFYGIPWNLWCANFDDTSSSMEFHGTWSASIPMTRAVPWNSMAFHWTWGAPISMTRTWRAPISLTRTVTWLILSTMTDVIKWKHFPRYWPLWGESTDQRWFPLTKASNAELLVFDVCLNKRLK